MNGYYLHEELYRGRETLERLGALKITLCGAGALGSLLGDNLVRQGIRQLTVVDRDRVEPHNVGTQLFGQADVGGLKADLLRAHCFRAAGVEIKAIPKSLEERTVQKFLRGAELVIDTFDNFVSREVVTRFCRENDVACLHAGMNADYGEVRWNEGYRVPSDVPVGNACEYPLARNLILLVVVVSSEKIYRYVLDGKRENASITLRDLKINQELA